MTAAQQNTHILTLVDEYTFQWVGKNGFSYLYQIKVHTNSAVKKSYPVQVWVNKCNIVIASNYIPQC